MVRKILLLVAILFISITSFAQQSVEGSIVSANDGTPVPFANILGLKSLSGFSSDIDGRFSGTFKSVESSIVVSAIGFKTDTIQITPSPMRIEIEPTSQSLEGIVVTALGIEREKRSIGYAVSEVSGDEVSQTNSQSAINNLSGKVPGLKISATNGGAASSSRIILRGNNSLTGDNQALIVVDGVPINNSTDSNSGDEWGGRDYGNGISDINADDIESITVLKGATASALYGSQAMDGVILVTTKKGKVKRGVDISFTSNTSIDRAYILYDLQNEYGAGRNGKFEGAWDMVGGVPVFNSSYDQSKGSWGPRMAGQTIVDWDGVERPFSAQPDNYKDYFEMGVTTSNSLGVSGSLSKIAYRLSAANISTKDIIPGSKVSRTNVGLNLSGDLLPKLKLKSYVSYVNNVVKNRPGLSDSHDNPNRNYIHMPRNISSSSLADYYQTPAQSEVTWYSNWNWMTNPYWNIAYQENEDRRNRVFGHVSLEYELTPKIKAMIRTAPDYSKTNLSSIDAQGGLLYGQGRYAENNKNTLLINSDFLVNYTESHVGDFAYNMNIGGNAMYYRRDADWASTEGGLVVPYDYSLANSLNPISGRSTLTEAAKNSLYAFGQVSYKSVLYLDLTARNDWSSTLPESNNSFFYPSINLGFVFTELFNSDVISEDIFSFGKIRASYAGVGNDAEPYQLQTNYEIIDNEGYNEMQFINSTIANLGLLPEIVNSYEFGTNLNFFMDRVDLDFSYYHTRSNNQITNMPVSAASGYYSAIVNSGIIENKGVEIQLNTKPIYKEDFAWNLNFGYAQNKSQIVELAPNVERVTLYEHWRLAIEARPDNPYGDIVGYGFLRDENDAIIVDKFGMPVRDKTPKVLGNFTPDFSLSLSSNIRYKSWNLYFLLDSRVGGDIFVGTNMYGYGYAGNFEETLEGRAEWYASEAEREAAGVDPEDWIATGGFFVEGVYADGTVINGEDVSGMANSSYIDPYQYYQKVSLWQEEIHEPFIYDASFVKLREVRLSYDLPSNFTSKLKLKKASIAIYATNLWLIFSNVPNVDPESMLTNGNGQGYELYSYPNRRSYGFSLTINI